MKYQTRFKSLLSLPYSGDFQNKILSYFSVCRILVWHTSLQLVGSFQVVYFSLRNRQFTVAQFVNGIADLPHMDHGTLWSNWKSTAHCACTRNKFYDKRLDVEDVSDESAV